MATNTSKQSASSSFSSSASSKAADDNPRLQLIKEIAEKDFGLKLVPQNDPPCEKCGNLEKENLDLHRELDGVKAQLTKLTDLIGDLSRMLNFQQQEDPTVEHHDSELLKTHLEKILTDYKKLQNFVKKPIVIEDLLKLTSFSSVTLTPLPSVTLTPLPSPNDPPVTNTTIHLPGTTDTTAKKNQAHPSKENPSVNNQTTASCSGTRFHFSTSNSSTVTPNLPTPRTTGGITMTTQPLRKISSSKRPAVALTSNVKTVAPPSSEQPSVRKSSRRRPTRPVRYAEDSSKDSTPSPHSTGGGPSRKRIRKQFNCTSDCQKKIRQCSEARVTPPERREPVVAVAPSPPQPRTTFSGGLNGMGVGICPKQEESSEEEEETDGSCEMYAESDDSEKKQDENNGPPAPAPPPPPVAPSALVENQGNGGNPNGLPLNRDVRGQGGNDGGSIKSARCQFCKFIPGTISKLRLHMGMEHLDTSNRFSVKCRWCRLNFSLESFQSHPCKKTKPKQLNV